MKLKNLATFVQCAHWSYLVDGDFPEPGGLLLSAPSGSFKTTVLKSLSHNDRVLIMSDINVPTMNNLRDDIAYGKYRTLVFTELQKIYDRDKATARNIEGHIRGFVDEGFGLPSYQDARIVTRRASCVVLGAVTPKCYNHHFTRWNDTGFLRRFLIVHYALSNTRIINEAIHQWMRISLPTFVIGLNHSQKLPYNLTTEDSELLRNMLPPDDSTSFTLLKKITCVMKHIVPNDYLEIICEVGPCFQTPGGELDIEFDFQKTTTVPEPAIAVETATEIFAVNTVAVKENTNGATVPKKTNHSHRTRKTPKRSKYTDEELKGALLKYKNWTTTDLLKGKKSHHEKEQQ